MNDDEKLIRLRKIEKKIVEVLSSGDTNFKTTEGVNDYLNFLAGAFAFFFPTMTPIGALISNGLQAWIKNSMLPAISRWRVNAVLEKLKKNYAHQYEQWQEELYQINVTDETRILLYTNLTKILRNILNKERRSIDVQNLVQQFMIDILTEINEREFTKVVKGFGKMRGTELALLHQNLQEISIILHKIKHKNFSDTDPLIYELDIEDYRKIYCFKDESCDYSLDIQDLEFQSNNIRSKIKALIEFNEDNVGKIKKKMSEQQITPEQVTPEQKTPEQLMPEQKISEYNQKEKTEGLLNATLQHPLPSAPEFSDLTKQSDHRMPLTILYGLGAPASSKEKKLSKEREPGEQIEGEPGEPVEEEIEIEIETDLYEALLAKQVESLPVSKSTQPKPGKERVLIKRNYYSP